MVCRVRHADAQTKIHFPFRRKVQIDGRKELMLLLSDGEKIRCRANSAIVFKSAGDFFCKVVAELEIRRERDALVDTIAVKRPVKRRIERDVPRADLLINDGPDFPGPSVGGIPAPLVANLVRKTCTDGPVPLFWHAHAGADVVADPVPSLAILRRSENIKTCFKPVREPVRNFDSLVYLVIGGKHAVLDRL